jgi:acetate kinase
MDLFESCRAWPPSCEHPDCTRIAYLVVPFAALLLPMRPETTKNQMIGRGDTNILVFNPGSSSLKFEIITSDPPTRDVVSGKKLVRGVVEPIDANAKLSWNSDGRKSSQVDLPVKHHGEAAREILRRIDSGMIVAQGVNSIKDLHIVGHRVVHADDRYTEPVLVDDDVISTIEELEELAPLHNVAALAVIKATQSILDHRIPSIAVFDTAFHRTIPDRARIYAIPWELTVRHRIHRNGFHGISHNYLLLRYAQLTETPLEQTNIISLHLEGGSSATAIVGGRSIDTSMGFTPLEGLMMGTRSGTRRISRAQRKCWYRDSRGMAEQEIRPAWDFWMFTRYAYSRQGSSEE